MNNYNELMVVKEMDKIAIDNLDIIINELQYTHICVYPSDLVQFTVIPQQKRRFYECLSKTAMRMGKKGFFNNGVTTCWGNWGLETGLIKIATQLPTDSYSTAWSDPLSFRSEGDANKIRSYMKLKAFW